MTIQEMIEATSEEYMLRLLAEECSELAQAALKLVRAVNGETPVSIRDARRNLIEELADVRLMSDTVTMGMLTPAEDITRQDIYWSKRNRFIERIKAKQNPTN